MNAKDVILARALGSGGGGGGGVQSDWNINDETDPAYIKNRPFYSEETYTEILPEQAVVCSEMGEGIYAKEDFIPDNKFSPGDTLKVIWDGEPYRRVVSENYMVGNISLTGEIFGGGEDTGEPFFIVSSLLCTSDSENHTIEILKVDEQIVPVPEKFLPKTINPMRVEITGNGTDGYSANCSKAEIMAAYNSGKFVYAVYPYSVHEYLFYLSSPPKNGYDHPAVFRSYDFYKGYVNYTTSAFFAIYDEGVEFIDVMASGIILKSSKSDKRFKIEVNDSGTLTATEIT